MTTFQLSSVAPRLALARDQWITHKREADRVEVAHQAKIHDLQALVAHRELQLVRAYATGNGAYITRRQNKLRQAHRRLTSVEKLAA